MYFYFTVKFKKFIQNLNNNFHNDFKNQPKKTFIMNFHKYLIFIKIMISQSLLFSFFLYFFK